MYQLRLRNNVASHRDGLVDLAGGGVVVSEVEPAAPVAEVGGDHETHGRILGRRRHNIDYGHSNANVEPTFMYLENILPYFASELEFRDPTITGTMEKFPLAGSIILAM